MGAGTNHSYIFIPISLKGRLLSFSQLQQQLPHEKYWEITKDEILYLYRYITDKMDISRPDDCVYFHMKLSGSALEEAGLGANGKEYSIHPRDEYLFDDHIDFKITNIHLFVFRSLICVAAIQVSFVDNDPLYMATGLYYLKKPNRDHIWIGENDTQKTVQGVLYELLPIQIQSSASFFFYLNSGMERSNTMSLTFHHEGSSVEKELYYLKNCYRASGFEYTDGQRKEDERLITSDDYEWGVTNENLACVITRKTRHIENAFIKHFCAQYLFMYVFLLHRKYDLYRILTDIGVGEQRDLGALKHYKELLFEYQADYSFVRITEVPQYHRLYKKIEEKMELDALFSDAMEPVTSLTQLRQEKSEEEQSKKNNEIESALGLLSVLTVFSALIDCYSYIEAIRLEMEDVSHVSPMSYVHLGFSILIIATVIFVIRKLRRSK